jgi:hypothetical protein
VIKLSEVVSATRVGGVFGFNEGSVSECEKTTNMDKLAMNVAAPILNLLLKDR